jgi:O-succinylhomoserine sulfhydrylase
MISGGAMIAFEIKGEKQQTFNFLNKLNLIDISNNLGDSKSLITHPATTTHSNLSTKEQLEINIKPTSCRLSVGIENHEDLIEDLKQGLQSI